METRRYFVGVAARDAVAAAIAGGYVEINHGKAGPLERMRDGDGIAFYSPRTAADGEVLQAFTALGYVCGNTLYQASGESAGDGGNASARPAVDDASARPAGDNASASPAGHDASAWPAVDDASARPAGDDASGRPAGDDASGRPFRRAARYQHAQPAPIRPMIDSLAFIRSKSHWGAPLRFGFLQVSVADFACIAEAMGCTTPEPVAGAPREAVG